jgi:hypothetical protein
MPDLNNFKRAFDQIEKKRPVGFLKDIARSISENNINRLAINEILKKYSITSYNSYKTEFLDIVLDYIEIVLSDDIITQEELLNCKQLKRIFKIGEGDFYKYKYDEVRILLLRQLYKLYADNNINKEEALEKVSLQELFDLSYDQFGEFDLEEAESALIRGANIMDLDVFIRNYTKGK